MIVTAGRDAIEVRTFRQIVEQVQAAFAPYRIEGVSAVDELIAERRRRRREKMIGRCVLDTSAVLALVFNEPGADVVLGLGDGAVLSAVSYSECVAKATDRGFPLAEAVRVLDSLRFEVVPFDRETAVAAGSLRVPTRRQNCSFADRACLATALLRRLPAVTGDRDWAAVDLGVEVMLFR